MRRLSLLALALLAVACGGKRDLSGAEIQALISGSTSTGHQDLYSYSFRRVYDANGTFKSYNDGATTPRTGRWWVVGDRECIRWDDQGQDLCRYLVTDDEGHYEKELVNHGGRRKRIVTYYTFVGPDGRDRRRISGGYSIELGGYSMDADLLVWVVPVLVALAVIGLLFFIILLRGKNDPTSTRSRLRRRFGKLGAGGRNYRWGDLARGPPGNVDQFARESAADAQPTQVFWAFELMLAQASGDQLSAVRRLWACLAPLPDDTVVEALSSVLQNFPEPNSLVAAFSNDLRFCYLVGKAYSAQAEKSRRDAKHFPWFKQGSLAFLGHVRERAQTPPPDMAPPQGMPYRGAWPAAVDYAALAAPAFETMMYMQLAAPKVSRHHTSSSSVGGG